MLHQVFGTPAERRRGGKLSVTDRLDTVNRMHANEPDHRRHQAETRLKRLVADNTPDTDSYKAMATVLGQARPAQLSAETADIADDHRPLIDRICARLARGEWYDGVAEGTPTIPADIIRLISLDQIFPSGLRLRNLEIDGLLDLSDLFHSSSSAQMTLALEDCLIRDTLNLSNARLLRLSLRNSRVTTVVGIDTQVTHGVDLRGLRSADHEMGQYAPADWTTAPRDDSLFEKPRSRQGVCRLCFHGALIGQGIELAGAVLVGEDDEKYPWALDLRQAVIGGDIGFCALGRDRESEADRLSTCLLGGATLNSARIGGSLWAQRTIFWSNFKWSIVLQSALIKGAVQFSGDDINRTVLCGWIDGLAATVGRGIHLHDVLLGSTRQAEDSEAGPDGETGDIDFAASIFSARINGGFNISNCLCEKQQKILILASDSELISLDVETDFETQIYMERATISGIVHVRSKAMHLRLEADDAAMGGLRINAQQANIFLPRTAISGMATINCRSLLYLQMHDCIIDGNLTLRCLERSKNEEHDPLDWVNHRVFASQSRITGDLTINCHALPYFDGAYIHFRQARIDGSVVIRGSGFGGLSLRGATIGEALRLKDVVLKKNQRYFDDGIVDLSSITVGGELEVGDLAFSDLLFPDCHVVRIRRKPVPCYPGFTISEYLLKRDGRPNAILSTLSSGKSAERVLLLDGYPNRFFRLNQEGLLRLRTIQEAESYLRLFSEFSWINNAPFLIRDRGHDSDPEELRELLDKAYNSATQPIGDALPDATDTIDPATLKFRVERRGKHFLAQAVIQHGDELFLAQLELDREGSIFLPRSLGITMDDDGNASLPYPKIVKPFRLLDGDHDQDSFPLSSVFGPEQQGHEAEDMPSAALSPSRPFIISLKGSVVESLNDEDGTAWLRRTGDETRRYKVLRLDLDGLRYRRFGRQTDKDEEDRRISGNAAGLGATGRLRGEGDISDNREKWLDRQRVHWTSGEMMMDFSVHRPQPYRQFINVCQSSGYSSLATEIAVRLAKINQAVRVNDYRRTLADVPFHRPAWWKLHASCALQGLWGNFFGACFRYGYSTIRSIVTVIVAIIIGAAGATYANANGLLVVDLTPTASVLSAEESGPQVPTITRGSGPPVDARCGDAINTLSYAVDLFVPVVEVQQAHRCRIRSRTQEDAARYPAGGAYISSPFSAIVEFLGALTKDPRIWFLSQTLYTIMGWIIVSLSILTATGILRRQGLREADT